MLDSKHKKQECVLLFSGGQDSTTCLYWAKKHFKKVYAVGFDYGQKHKIELEQAYKIAKKENVDYQIFNIANIMTKSSLTSNDDHSAPSHINENLQANFTTGRNIIFLSIVGGYASEKKINNIVTGVCQTDYSGYPDCRKTSIDAFQNVLSLAYGSGDFIIHTPLMYLTKAETFKLAKELNCLDVIINETLTDYNGDMTFNAWGYGKPNNPATKLRMEGFIEAKKNNWI